MALFTSKADASLPLLTQLYQLEHDEIPAWLNLRFQMGLSEEIAYAAPGEPMTEQDKDLARFSELLGVVCMIMEALADVRPPVPGALDELNFWIRECLEPPSVILEARGRIELSRSNQQEMVLTELIGVIDAPWEAKRCEQCQSVYQLTSARQKFCSVRCADRSRLHKFRRKNKATVESVAV
jgi:hypothetical protein